MEGRQELSREGRRNGREMELGSEMRRETGIELRRKEEERSGEERRGEKGRRKGKMKMRIGRKGQKDEE